MSLPLLDEEEESPAQAKRLGPKPRVLAERERKRPKLLVVILGSNEGGGYQSVL